MALRVARLERLIWIGGPAVTSTSMRVIGLALVLAAQASMMMTARRHGVPAPRVRDDEPVRPGPL